MITRRASMTTLVAVAVAGLASGCCLATREAEAAVEGTASGPGKGTVEVMYGFGGTTGGAFQKDLNTFAQANGFTVKFTKAGSWDTEIRSRVAGGNPPDVGLFPQPGVMCDLAKQKKVLACDDADVETAQLRPGHRASSTPARAPTRRSTACPSAVSVKSLLWYDQANFKATGDQMPTTLDACSRSPTQLKSQGKVPWCIAAESGQATGWPITDWIEDLVLRLAGPENYDKWVTGALKFNSPEIKPAFEYFQKIAFTDANVRGGTKSIVATNFQTGGNALFENPPGCYLFKQATFVAGKGGFPDSVLANLDTTVGAVLSRRRPPATTRPQRWRPRRGVQQRLQHHQAAQLHRQQGQRNQRRQGRVLLAAQVLRRLALPEQDDPEASRRTFSTRRPRCGSTGRTSCRPRSVPGPSGPSRSSGSRVSRTSTPR